MRKLVGFIMRRRVRRVSRWVLGKTQIRRSGYNRLHPTIPARKLTLPITKLKNWSQRLTQKFSLLGFTKGSECKPDPVPRGHLAVYVGQKDGEFRRVLVPIVYFNHPLFGELLRESEKSMDSDTKVESLYLVCIQTSNVSKPESLPGWILGYFHGVVFAAVKDDQ